MSLFWAIFLGIVQGVTEFFPVSSSAHLALIPWIFRFPDPGLAFDVALHAGTLVAILIAFWTDWIGIFKGLFSKGANFEKRFFLFLILTSIPGAIFGVLLESKAETVFRSPLLVAAALVIFGFVLVFVDRTEPNTGKIQNLNSTKAFAVGLSQALAIIPGVSRSGATITAGRLFKLKREEAAKYSFMAAAPIILGAAIFSLRKIPAAELISNAWILGFLAALVSSFFAIRFLLSYLKTKDFKLFLWWRIALSVIVVLIYLMRR